MTFFDGLKPLPSQRGQANLVASIARSQRMCASWSHSGSELRSDSGGFSTVPVASHVRHFLWPFGARRRWTRFEASCVAARIVSSVMDTSSPLITAPGENVAAASATAASRARRAEGGTGVGTSSASGSGAVASASGGQRWGRQPLPGACS